jgi:pimeloyl-ACP methyl ester carboxylesterase
VHEDRFVDAHDGIRLAVRDHGGTGPDLLLLHGAGSHLLSLFNLVRKLEDRFRVVTMDARWSGQSGDSERYDWGDLVRDAEAVVDQVGLSEPVVAGHSWGGMIAAHYGAVHPEARAVINIDGHGSGDRSLYDGVTDDEYEQATAMLDAQQSATPGRGDAEGDEAWLAAEREQLRSFMTMVVPADRLDEFVERNFVELEPGRWRRHPAATLFEGLRGDLDLFSLYRRIECPLQVFNCTGEPVGMPAGLVDFMQAYRRGLTRALGELAVERPNVDVVTLPDHHHNGVLAGGAKVAAAEIGRFVAALG